MCWSIAVIISPGNQSSFDDYFGRLAQKVDSWQCPVSTFSRVASEKDMIEKLIGFVQNVQVSKEMVILSESGNFEEKIFSSDGCAVVCLSLNELKEYLMRNKSKLPPSKENCSIKPGQAVIAQYCKTNDGVIELRSICPIPIRDTQ